MITLLDISHTISNTYLTLVKCSVHCSIQSLVESVLAVRDKCHSLRTPSCGQGRVYTCKRSVNRRRNSFVASTTEIKAIYK